MRNGEPLSITKTEGEWKVIDEIILANNKKGLAIYLRGEIKKLKEAFDNCEDCVVAVGGEVVRKRPFVTKEQYEDVVIIAKKMNIKPSDVIIKLIIDPLLVPEF